jgi:hypothetical protein
MIGLLANHNLRASFSLVLKWLLKFFNHCSHIVTVTKPLNWDFLNDKMHVKFIIQNVIKKFTGQTLISSIKKITKYVLIVGENERVKVAKLKIII